MLVERRNTALSGTADFPSIWPRVRHMTENSMREAAREAFLYALPMTEIAKVREAAILRNGLPAGRFFAQRGLITPKDRFVTTPNVDTIYANVFIDLSQGPATITLPPFGDRYASLSLMDMFSDN